MKKRLVCLLLVALTVMVCTAAMAAGTYSVGIKQERLVNNVSRNESAPESIYYVDWIDNPTKIKATAVNSRVSLSWDPVPAIDLYSIYEKIGGTWKYKEVTATASVSFTASDGTHEYGVSSIWRADNGDFYESEYVRTVTIAVLDGEDDPRSGDVIQEIRFSGYSDKSVSVTAYENTFLRIKTDSLTWFVGGSNGAVVMPDKVSSVYYTSLGNDIVIKASKYLSGSTGTILVATYDYSLRTVDGKTCYAVGENRAYLTIKLTRSEGRDPAGGTQVKLNKSTATLTRTASKLKPTLKLKATVTSEDGDDVAVTWKSSNVKIAKVDKTGEVTALKPGKVTITCTAKDGSGDSASCEITVKDKQVSKITLNKTKATLRKGDTLQLSVKKVTPTTAVDQKVKWSTSDKSVATVSKTGKVTAKAPGTCVITCTAHDGSGKTVKVKITVKK